MSWFRKHRYNSAAIKAQDYDLLLSTYKTSRFAGLEQVLIGYRQDRISVRKRIETGIMSLGLSSAPSIMSVWLI